MSNMTTLQPDYPKVPEDFELPDIPLWDINGLRIFDEKEVTHEFSNNIRYFFIVIIIPVHMLPPSPPY